MEDGFNLRFGMGTRRFGTFSKILLGFAPEYLVSDVLSSVLQISKDLPGPKVIKAYKLRRWTSDSAKR